MKTFPSFLLRHARLSEIAILAVTVASLMGGPLHASTYMTQHLSADYSGLTSSGGTIVVPLALSSGAPIDGLGSSFDMTFTVSPITAYDPSGPFSWSLPAIAPDVPYFGQLYPSGIYDNIPASNQNNIPRTIDGITIGMDGSNGDAWTQAALAKGYLYYIGGFTIATSALPTTPDGYAVVDAFVKYGFSWHYNFLGNDVTGGYASYITSNSTEFGATVSYEFLAFIGSSAPDPQAIYPIWISGASVSYEAIPEPTSVMLLILPSILLLNALRSKQKRLELGTSCLIRASQASLE